jgi:hypothetical protein
MPAFSTPAATPQMHRNHLIIFRTLRSLRALQRRYLPYLETLEDLGIVREIGFNQEAGKPITLKRLFLEKIGSVATVQRRVRRLKRLGIILQERSQHDKRNLKLTISPQCRSAYRRKALLLRLD